LARSSNSGKPLKFIATNSAPKGVEGLDERSNRNVGYLSRQQGDSYFIEVRRTLLFTYVNNKVTTQ
jgi:hypothetical protein